MSLLYTKVGKLLSYHLYVFVFLLYFYKISLVYSFFTVFSRKQQKKFELRKKVAHYYAYLCRRNKKTGQVRVTSTHSLR